MRGRQDQGLLGAFPGLGDPFGRGGITWALDNIMAALEDASRHEDAREYANLATQLAVIVAPKLTPDEYDRLTEVKIDLPHQGLRRREARREYERQLFKAARKNVFDILKIVSERGIYAKADESPVTPEDASSLAVR